MFWFILSQSKTIGYLLLALVVTSCTNMSSLQTAKTLKKDQGRFLIGGEMYHGSKSINGKRDSVWRNSKGQMGYVDIGYRRGIAKDLDIGVKLIVFSLLFADVKYQIIKENEFVLSAGFGAGTSLPLSIRQVEGPKTSRDTVWKKMHVYEVTFPLYISYDINRYFSLYTSPKYIFHTVEGNYVMHMNLVGITGGVKLGKKIGLFLESTYVTGLGSDFGALNVSGAFYF